MTSTISWRAHCLGNKKYICLGQRESSIVYSGKPHGKSLVLFLEKDREP